ncbi:MULTISPECIES: nitrogen assimilation response regulator NtrX [Pseudorhizobium]|uniref:C4-dicarboxylate transport transcriptional regulatory protein DctD n=1 Tax=Pseudorhizobium pelagicum TaxID=1509405 RepID=A0A922T9W9_9HYPH|nr:MULTISPECIES: sigma-54 dependent transcriptional regulator [Pseudorhizobium]MBU1314909.1 sigma-54 dependent transcriptional regulator [Alphaproteobacteria bacterium]MDY6960410.1 sigma-54 dependent transcriptional regulator [Pseudomonadota bacterium]KEQ03441.1 ATPase AAA [Pseudorhizobium pelagicum]KEQ03985.1 ATPase AAA [Pseudorhizobium pelagicum]MBU1549991.1 sigma-54 dependent transcriptional regulator [Alphaproteobacteria bacterium]|tara:strand:+ start:669 stop:2033 length:1365 start_codon:yes stop_codon:yes gene_type:complete
MASDILVVDDETDIREIVSGILSDEGHETRMAHDSDSALAAISDRVPRLVFLDIWMQGSKLDGLALLDELKSRHPDLPVVMISGHGNVETAVSAIKRGAFDFIEKPFKADRLILIAERALENSNLKREVTELKKRTGDAVELVGTSVSVSQLRQTIDKVAPTNSRIMILGPSGSGKELVARMVHKKSSRANGPFVALNAATITPDRMEIALFGTEGGPGQARKIGALEEAHRGILYLDEVGEMPRETQNKILRVLVDQQFERVGGSKRVKVDVRIISSTAYNLENLISEGIFREDLYHRLAVVPIKVPALAERREDIPFLVDMFMRQISEQAGIRPRKIGEDAMAVLQAHDWPGNIRQLRNNIERLMILARTDGPDTSISADMLPPDLGDMLPKISTKGDYHIMTLPLREAREMFERDYLIAQINRFGGNISRTAEFVGMERSALHRKLKSLGV